MHRSWFQREFQFPKWSIKGLGIFIALLVLPNLLFWLIAFYFNTSRPIFNLDYFISIFLLLWPYKTTRFLGISAYLLLTVTDGLMFAIQVFPFLELGAILYLLPFAKIAPTRYIIMGTLFIISIAITAWLMYRIAKQSQQAFYPVLLLALLCVIANETAHIKYASYLGGIMGRNNYYLIYSQSHLYQAATQTEFASFTTITPKIKPYPPHKERAATHLSSPQSSKILYIVAESWGYPRTEAMQNHMLEEIHKMPNIEGMKTGYFDFFGSTVQGEMRELCALDIHNGYAFRKLDASYFKNCLPNQFKQHQYKTYALHGTSGQLYDRYDWYLKAGFQNLLFGEHFPDLKRCTPFNGVCDHELIQVVSDTFKQNTNNKIFFYWLTLTSHVPYAAKDIVNNRFDCQRFGIGLDTEICRNAKLQTQFLDNIANLASQPHMKGVEVVVVGDHMPPILSGEPIQPHLRWQDVNWLHFQIKN